MPWLERQVMECVCRLTLPNTVADTFDEAFGDKDVASSARSDPLVVLDPPRLAFSLDLLRSLPPIQQASLTLQIPWLVRPRQMLPLSVSTCFAASSVVKNIVKS